MNAVRCISNLAMILNLVLQGLSFGKEVTILSPNGLVDADGNESSPTTDPPV